MAYLAVNKDGKEVRFEGEKKPIRHSNIWIQEHCKIPSDANGFGGILYLFGKTLPFGSIIALTGRKLTFDDEPIKI